MHKWLLRTLLATLMTLIAATGGSLAQYQPIPNFTGIGAGFNFRQAINQRFSGAATISPQLSLWRSQACPQSRTDCFCGVRTARRPHLARVVVRERGRAGRVGPGVAHPDRWSRI